MLATAVLASLAMGSHALCADVKNKLKEAHINVLSEIDLKLAAPPLDSTPQQLHLSLTGLPNEFFITWAVPDGGDICKDSHATIGTTTFTANWTAYEAGVAGWAGHIYTARMTGLAAGAPFSYSVTSCGKTTGPITSKGPRAVDPTGETLVAIMADMGTVIPLGFATAQQIEKDHAKEAFDLFVLAGDIAYATTDPPHDELEEVWDAYGRMTEPFMSLAPFQPNVGNHEHTPGTLTNASGTFKVDYAAYQARYAAVPPTGNSNLWYSYDFGNIHFTCIDSEESQAPNSPQAIWMAADLAAADANRANVPWLVMMQHRPVYSSTKSEAGDHTPGSGFPLTLEPYTSKYHVDLFLTGHEHQAERTFPVYNGTVSPGVTNNTYVNPTAPVYVVQGTSGAFVSGDWIDPQPKWSAFRDGTSYGYGKMRVTGAQSLDYSYISIEGKVLDHFTIIRQ